MFLEVDNSRQDEILSYIGNDYPKCLYLYIDMQKYGCSSEVTQTWMQEHDGKITTVVLIYHTALHVFSKELDFKINELAEFILQKNPSIICASAELIHLLEPKLCAEGYISEYGHVGRLTSCEPSSTECDITLAGKDDINEIAKLLYEDKDIGASYSMSDLIIQIEERMTDGYVRSYVIKDNNHVVAHVATGAEISKLCTICYTITDINYRGRGYFRNLMAYICAELQKEGKEIYSVYYMENARRQHHRVGFVDCCECGKLYRNIE